MKLKVLKKSSLAESALLRSSRKTASLSIWRRNTGCKRYLRYTLCLSPCLDLWLDFHRHALQDVVEQIHSQFHARKHLQKRMVVDVKRMGRSEIRAAIEEQAQKSQQNEKQAEQGNEKPSTENKADGNNVVEEGKEEESFDRENDSEEPMDT